MKIISFFILAIAVCGTAFSQSFELKIVTQGFGTGTIVGSRPDKTKLFICDVQPGNTGSTTCTKSLPSGSITLTATPATGHTFSDWSHGTGSATACSGNAPCTFNLSTNSTILATIFPPSTLTLRSTGPGKARFTMNNGSVITCESGHTLAEPFLPNSLVSITALPDHGQAFLGWSVLSGSPAGVMCSATANPCSFRIDKRIFVEAKFGTPPSPPPQPPPPPAPTVTIIVSKDGSGTGTVTDNQGMNCGGDCSSSAGAGTRITLRALPSSGSTFKNWSNGTGSAAVCNNSTTSFCSFTLDQNSTIRATFNLTQ